MIEKDADIDACSIQLTEFDIDYLAYKKVSKFGKYQDVAELCEKRRSLADQIIKELNMLDVNTVIYTY